MAAKPSKEDIDQAAIGWVMARNDAPGDAAVREGLAAWLAADAAHRAAYEEARKVWLLTGLLPAQAEPHAEVPQAPSARVER